MGNLRLAGKNDEREGGVKEKPILDAIMLSAPKLGSRLFRNNVGVLQDENGQHVRYGLCTGSSDLIGWKEVTVTPEMVGKKVAVFLAVEVKTGNLKPTKEQTNFIEAVTKAGGIAFVARDSETVTKLLEPIQ